MNFIITNNKSFFENIGEYNYCNLEDMVLPPIIAVDTETTGLKPRLGHMFAVQIGTGENNYLIDLQTIGDKPLTFDQVKPYLQDKTMVFQNAVFDIGWFYKYDFWPDTVYDTMIASMLLENGDKSKRHDFGSVMRRHLKMDYDKSEQKNISKVQLSTNRAIQYCFNDVDRLLELMKVLSNRMRDYGVVPAFKLHCKYIRALAYMEQCGLPINTEKWAEKMMHDEQELNKSEQKVIDYIYKEFPEYRDNQIDMFSTEFKVKLNLNSPSQMIPVFQKLGINVQSDEDPTKETLNKDVIRRSGHEFVDIWLNFKEAAHNVSTYGQNILDKVEDGRIYTSFNPVLDTARISTRRNQFNCLNLPATEATRKCFEAKPGFKMVVADYEGQENVVGADLHKDPVMVASIVEGKDLHCALTRVLFPETKHLSDDEIKTKHKDKRNFSKPVRFAKAYGAGGYTIAKSLNIPEEDGEQISAQYDELHSSVKIWGESVLEKAGENGYIESAEGFKLKLPFFEEYAEYKEELDKTDKFFWKLYREGKIEYKAKNKAKEEGEEYAISNEIAYQHYLDNKSWISHFFRLKSKYYRLCLNNPVQATSAFVTKRSAVLLFDYIVKNNHQWRVKIVNIPHDEFVLEVEESLAEEYKKVLEDCMITGGNFYLKSGLVKLQAEANIGDNWYEAK